MTIQKVTLFSYTYCSDSPVIVQVILPQVSESGTQCRDRIKEMLLIITKDLKMVGANDDMLASLHVLRALEELHEKLNYSSSDSKPAESLSIVHLTRILVMSSTQILMLRPLMNSFFALLLSF